MYRLAHLLYFTAAQVSDCPRCVCADWNIGLPGGPAPDASQIGVLGNSSCLVAYRLPTILEVVSGLLLDDGASGSYFGGRGFGLATARQ